MSKLERCGGSDWIRQPVSHQKWRFGARGCENKSSKINEGHARARHRTESLSHDVVVKACGAY